MSIDDKVHPLSRGHMRLGGKEHLDHLNSERDALVYIMKAKFHMREAEDIYTSLLGKNLHLWWTSEGNLPDWYVRSKTNKEYRDYVKELYSVSKKWE